MKHIASLLQVSGLDLNKPLSDEQRQLLMDVWRHYDVLAFRGQELSPADQERLLRVFPHDGKAIDEGRFCNMYFQPRVPSNPLVSAELLCGHFTRPSLSNVLPTCWHKRLIGLALLP